MPPPTDIPPLARAIADYTALSIRRAASGHLALTGDTPYNLICREIAQTRLPRRLTFFAGDDMCLDIVVRNSRVVAMHPADAPDAPVTFITGTSDEAARLVVSLASAEITGRPLSVQIRRNAEDLDPSAAGLSPNALLDALTALDIPSDTPPDDPAMLQSIEDGPTDFKRWIEGTGDQTFDEITFLTAGGQTLMVRFTSEGLRLAPGTELPFKTATGHGD